MALDPRNLARWGSGWLLDQQKAHWSSPVLYARGAASVEVRAQIGRTPFGVDSGAGMVVEEVSRDFIVLAADLVIDGQQIEPRAGDRITETLRGRTFVYEVNSPGKGQPWRWDDDFGTAYRIYTKQVQA